MSVYIPKDRLGSGSGPRTRVVRGERLASLPGFQQVQQAFQQAAHQQAEERKAKWDGNAEVQRRRMMTQEERSRGAIERVAKNMKELEDMKAGADTSFETARSAAEKIAYKSDRQKAGE